MWPECKWDRRAQVTAWTLLHSRNTTDPRSDYYRSDLPGAHFTHLVVSEKGRVMPCTVTEMKE